jgi:hypothetical protein
MSNGITWRLSIVSLGFGVCLVGVLVDVVTITLHAGTLQQLWQISIWVLANRDVGGWV